MLILSKVWWDLYKGYNRVLELDAKLPPDKRKNSDLINLWKERLSFSPARSNRPRYTIRPTSMSLRDNGPVHKLGDSGENELMSSLADNLDDRFYAFQSFLVANHLDIDVLVVGPTGIWVLESKAWAGTITLSKGNWSRQKWGGSGSPEFNQKWKSYEVPQQREKVKSFDRQWLMEKNEVLRMMGALRSTTDKSINYGSFVHGGLVFTHPRAELKIDNSSKARSGTIQQWIGNIKYGSVNHDLNEKNLMQIMGILLKGSMMIRSPQGRYSAVFIAEQLYKDALATTD